MKKRLLILPLFAAFTLAGCDFDINSLMFWKKESAQQKEEQEDKEPEEEKGEEAESSVTSVKITTSGGTVELGASPVQLQVTVTVTGDAAKTVNWSTSASSVATVSSSGLVSFVGAGNATITATSTVDSTKKDSVRFTVTDSGGGEDIEPASYVVTFKTNSSDSSSEITDSASILAQLDSGSEYVASASGSKVFAGASGLKLGSSKASGSVTFNLTSSVKGKIEKLKVESSEYSSDTGSLKVYVNGTQKGEIDPSEGGTITDINEEVTSLKFETTAKRAYLCGFTLSIGDGEGGGGGEETAEFPSEAVNAYTESLGSNIHLPVYSGTAKGYTFNSEEGYLDISVDSGEEQATIATYVADLLGSNDFVEGNTDSYGDMHYVSTDEILDVCVWDGNDAQTANPGHVYVDIYEYVAPSTTLPTATINEYLEYYEYGFSISTEMESAINKLSSQFSLEITGDDDYEYLTIGISGKVADELNNILSSALVTAGYELYADEEGSSEGAYYYFSEETYASVYIQEKGESTFLYFF